jgi:osmotically inducible lipoprotein OsmB
MCNIGIDQVELNTSGVGVNIARAAVQQEVVLVSMITKLILIGLVALNVGACGRTTGTRAVTGGLLGAGGGAAVGSVTGLGAGTGALLGGGAGAAGGALTAPHR